MKKKLVFTIAGLILAISQSFATGTPIVYTDEATFKAALGSESNLDEFNDLTNGKMVDSLNRTFGDFEYKIEDELKRKDGLYELTGILSFNFKGGASVIDPAVFLITNKGKSINAFGANFYTTDINGNFVSGKEITVKVGTYEYKYIPTKTTSFIGFILPNTIDSIKISCYDSYNTMDHFYVGNNLSSEYKSGDAITSTKDNTINEATLGGLGNSTGLIYVGNIAKTDTITRRGLVQFDLSSVPTNVTIDSVKLVMSLQTSADMTIEMYKVTSDWGEGTSYSAGGAGVAATTNDVTWLHSFYNSTFWTKPGGDYDATIADSKTIKSTDTTMIMSSDQMKANVAAWVTDASTNHGWLLKSTNETISAKGIIAKFYSKETAPTQDKKPTMKVYYHSVTDALKSTSAASDLTIYPVPATDRITISTAANIRSVKVLDLSGKTLLSGTDSAMDVSPLIKGMYLMQVSTDKGIFTRQLIKK